MKPNEPLRPKHPDRSYGCKSGKCGPRKETVKLVVPDGTPMIHVEGVDQRGKSVKVEIPEPPKTVPLTRPSDMKFEKADKPIRLNSWPPDGKIGRQHVAPESLAEFDRITLQRPIPDPGPDTDQPHWNPPWGFLIILAILAITILYYTLQ